MEKIQDQTVTYIGYVIISGLENNFDMIETHPSECVNRKI